MLRFRRYRAFLICAVLLTILLYHVSKNSEWDPASSVSHRKPPPAPVANTDSRPQTGGRGSSGQGSHGKGSQEVPQGTGAHGEGSYAQGPHEKGPLGVGSQGKVSQQKKDGPSSSKEQAVRIPVLKEDNLAPGGYGLPVQTPTFTRPKDGQGSKGLGKLPADARPTTTKAAIPFNDAGEDGPGPKGKRPATDQGDTSSSTSSVLHWVKPTERYPVEKESLIALPTGKPSPIPAIQYRFSSEAPEAKQKRISRLQKVKAEAKRAWLGYKKYAWTHDEVKPVSLKFKDPFCGWAATLVDSLDTLWIMGMKEEFEDAVLAVKDIDFTTSPYRSDIPVFETVIRYLGGLIAAYDVSGGSKSKYTVLLDKAIELAEILMGTFDTPNRMPILYYSWKPSRSSQQSRASTSASVAELGSMTMEFTRLAQLTGEIKYYDAVARITDAFDEWQQAGTSIDGIFPEGVDASGCNRSSAALSAYHGSSDLAMSQTADVTDADDPQGYASEMGHKSDALKVKHDSRTAPGTLEVGSHPNITVGSPEMPKMGLGSRPHEMQKRSNIEATSQDITRKTSQKGKASQAYTAKGQPIDWECAPQGLTAGGWGYESYSMGGSQDSTYEYFPKMWLLLGGLEPKYRTMHGKVVAAVKKNLLYRPMVEDDRDILFSAKLRVQAGTSKDPLVSYEITHLTCFLGGMFGLGGKIFQSPDDVEIGKKLADGCAWAYEVMPTGLMAEAATALPCPDMDVCHWNQSAWYDHLDPNADWRETQMKDYLKEKKAWEAEIQELKLKQRQLENSAGLASAGIKTASIDVYVVGATHNSVGVQRRSGDDISSDIASGAKLNDLNGHSGSSSSPSFGKASQQVPLTEADWPAPPVKPVSHEEFVESRIKSERLPPGLVALDDRRYILRPEAIESVWYMYRITGDTSWQEKGWRMFEAVIEATQAEGGHSAIDDVAPATKPMHLDNMESFWLAETLKYFYLLFETPDVISLDDWVLNTEAHPLKRPT